MCYCGCGTGTKGEHMTDKLKLLDDYFLLQNKIYSYFGYVENWRVIPIADSRNYYWYLEEEGPGTVYYADTEEELKTQEGNYYEESIYTQRFLPKWVYRVKDFTMVCVDTNTDGNKFLRIFDNSRERKP
jgi:hypothetical protein